MEDNARYYDPTIGRFISPDSVMPDYANPQDLNRYSYVRGNPVRFTDPSGHALECGGGIDECNSHQWSNPSGIYDPPSAAVLIARPSEILNPFIINVKMEYDYGTDTNESKNWGAVAYMADVFDFGFTAATASTGILGGVLTEGSATAFAEILGKPINVVTFPIGTIGLNATVLSDIYSHRTSIETQNTGFKLAVGVDTVVNSLTWLGGDANMELYTAAMADTGQILWDSSRRMGKNIPDSFVIEVQLKEIYQNLLGYHKKG